MSLIAARDKRVGFTTNTDYFEKAKEVAKANGTTISSAMDMFVKQIAITGRMELLNEEEMLFMQLKKEVNQRISDVQSGEYYTDEDLVKRYEL